MKKSTRQQAIANGEQKFYTGKPCKRGHLSPRNTLMGYCIACRNESQKAERAKTRLALGLKK